MKNKHGNIRCEGCGSYHMNVEVGFYGNDWDCVAGEGSGFGRVVELICCDCGRVYPIIHVKKETDVSEILAPVDVEVLTSYDDYL